MANLALERVSIDDSKRRADLTKLIAQILESSKKFGCHFGRLPLEVSAEIFELAVQTDYLALLGLLRVSRSWNSITWNSSSLWCKLVLRVKKPGWKARRWIQRSKGVIKHLEFSPEKSLFKAEDFEGMRWEYLDSLVLGELDIAGLQPAWLASMTRLRELHHSSEPLGVLNPVISFAQEPAIARSLRTLYLRGCHFITMDGLDILHSLETLAIIDPVVAGPDLAAIITTFLENNPHLRHFILAGQRRAGDIISVSTADQKISLPFLEEINLSDLSLRSLLQLLETPLPNLRHLSVTGSSDSVAEGLEMLTPSPSLETLDLSFIGLDSHTPVLELLRASPKLHTLSLQSIYNVAAPVLQALADDTSFCSHLTKVDVSGCPDVRSGPIVRLVKTRFGIPPSDPEDSNCESGSDEDGTPVARITSLTMDRCPLVEAETLPWLRQQVKRVSCVYMTKKEASFTR
ncbi:hypothetical protein DL96DRAFT_1612567 [Flagelloscypha sp. PMI_526]|nr:hypothetical protein DL96DRAFT_1612567 [Flagelloscypha sp. PMI_526]